MNKKILAIPVLGAVVAAAAKMMKKSSGAESAAAAAPREAGPDNTTDGQSIIR